MTRAELNRIREKYRNEPSEVREAAHLWFMEQAKWHQRRSAWLFGHAAQHWHDEQVIFYKKAAWGVLTITEIVGRTMRKRAAAVSENVSKHNALLTKLRKADKDEHFARP